MDCGQKCCTYCMKTGEERSLEMGAPEGIKLCMLCADMMIESMEVDGYDNLKSYLESLAIEG